VIFFKTLRTEPMCFLMRNAPAQRNKSGLYSRPYPMTGKTDERPDNGVDARQGTLQVDHYVIADRCSLYKLDHATRLPSVFTLATTIGSSQITLRSGKAHRSVFPVDDRLVRQSMTKFRFCARWLRSASATNVRFANRAPCSERAKAATACSSC